MWQLDNRSKRRLVQQRYCRKHKQVVRRTQKVERWAQKLLQDAKGRSRRRGHSPPTITEAWILAQPLICPYLGVTLSLSTTFRYLWQPSLDRIDNDKGYTPENTKLTSLAWNQMRNAAPLEEALRLVASIR